MKMVRERKIREAVLVYRKTDIPVVKDIQADPLKTPSAVFELAQKIIGDEGREVFVVFFMDSANKIGSFSKVSTGTVDQIVIYPKEVVRHCILSDATRVIVAHNHPSGVAKPSEHDIAITKKLTESCSAVDIEVLDHIVLGDKQYYSFREHGII